MLGRIFHVWCQSEKFENTNIFSFESKINLLTNRLQQKEINFSRELHNKLISSDKKYVNSKFIIIENYFNKNMTIVKVDYDKKSN